MDTLNDPSSVSTPQSKKRPRENETPSQRLKREKAAERQRRKRERDRNGGLAATANLIYSSDPAHIDIEGLDPPHHHHQDQSGEYMPSNSNTDPELTPAEIIRRDRVRAAARERQRKHRALVKQRKLQQLGLMMGNDVQGADGVHDSEMAYRVPPEAQYLPPEMHTPPPPQPHLDPQPGEPPFPQHQGHGGQMFATTLLLSFSCAPLLKQHLLSNLQMSNEELASLEPIIANAWDQWDRQRRQHYEQHGGPPPGTHFDPHPPTTSVPVGVAPSATTSSSIPNGSIPIGPTLTYPPHPNNPNAQHHPGQPGPGAPPPDASTAELRARFQRTLVTPTPFQAQAAAAAAAVAAAQAQAQAQHHQHHLHGHQTSTPTPVPTPTSVNPANTTLSSGKNKSNGVGGNGNSKSGNSSTSTSTVTSAGSSTTGPEIDPHLGAKGES